MGFDDRGQRLGAQFGHGRDKRRQGRPLCHRIDPRYPLVFTPLMPRPSPAADVQGLVVRLMEADFVAAHALWIEGHLRVLAGLRRVFGNDMDKIMVLAAIGQQMLNDPAMAGLAPLAEGDVFPPINRNRLTNAGSIAAAVGIPRESVRRKINELVAAGWVLRDADGRLSVAPSAATDLRPSTLDGIAMLDSLFGQYLSMMTAKGWITVAIHPDGGPQSG